MIVAPPGEPTARTGLPSSVTIVGDIELRGRLPGAGRFGSVPAGVVSTKVDVLTQAMRRLVDDPDEAAERGRSARAAALERYGLERFLADWDDVLQEVTTR